MSTETEDRIVRMEFENSSFERNINNTLESLTDLDESLAHLATSAANSLDVINSADVDDMGMSQLARSVDFIANKFTNLGIIGVTALVKITNQAIDTGERLVKSLSIDQVSAGWDKYTSKTASVQAIMNATGKSIEEVNQTLEKLMWFSDETSYGFTDMTRAIGIMTSSGGEIEEVSDMVMGLANAVALAGKGQAEFSRAIYNLNQAYGMGRLMRMDWMSFENANVNSKQLMEELIRVGEAMGTIKKGEVNVGNFRDSLASGWANKEVMEEAFSNFAKYSNMAFEMVQSGEVDTASEAYAKLAESYNDIYLTAAKSGQEAKSFAEAIDATKDAVSTGWMRTFEIIFGNYEEAKKLWTDLANTLWDVFASGAEERNLMLSEWKKMGGRTLVIEGIVDVWHTIVDLTSAIKEGFREIFPKTTVMQLANLTLQFRKWTRTVKISEKTLENIKITVKGVASVLDILLMPIRTAVKAFLKLTAVVGPVLDVFFAITAAIGNFAIAIRDSLKSMDPFNRTLQAVSDSIGSLLDGINSKLASFKKVDTENLSEGVEKIDNSMSPLAYIGEKISAMFDKLISLINATGEAFYKAGEFVGGTIASLATGFVDTLNALDFDRFREVLDTLLYSNIVVSLQTFVTSLTGITSSITESIGGFKGFGGALVETFEMIQSSLQADTLLKIAKATIMLAAAFVIFTTVPADKLAHASTAMSLVAANLVMMVNTLLPILKTDMFFTMFSLSAVLTTIGIAVLTIAGAIKLLSTIEFKDLAKGLGSLIVIMKALVATSAKLPILVRGMKLASFQLITLATSIMILTGAVKVLSTLDWAGLSKGLIGVGTLLASVAIFMKKTDSLAGISGSVGLIAMSTGILILAQAVKSIAAVKAADLAKSVAAIMALMAAMGVLSKGLSNNFNLMSIGTSMIFLGTAMNIMALAVKQLSDIPVEKLGNSLLALGAGLTEMTLASIAIDKAGGATIKNAIAMTVLATSLLVLAQAMTVFGNFSWEQTGQALLALGGSLAVLAVGLKAMSGTMKGSASLILAATALTMLAAPLTIFSQLGLKGVGVSLLMLAGVIGTFALSAILLQPVVPLMYSLAGALALFGAGTALVGTGLLAIGAGLTSIAAAIAVGSVSLAEFMDMFIQFIPNILKSIGEGIIKIAEVLVKAIPVFEQLIREGILAVLNIFNEVAPQLLISLIDLLLVIAEQLPKFIQAAVELITGFLTGIANMLPQIITAGVDVVIAFINGILENKYRIIDAAFDLVIGLIDGLATGFAERGGDLIVSVVNLGIGLIKGLINGAKELLPRLWEFIKETGGNIISGLINAIKAKAGELKDAIVGTVKNMWKGVTDFFQIHSPSKLAERTGGYVMEGFILGIEGSDSALSSAAKGVLSHFMEEFDKGVPIFATMGEDLMNSFSSGIDKRLAELEELQSSMKQAEEAELQRQEEVYNTQESLKDALKRAAQAIRKGEVGFDNQAAIQGYMTKLGRGIAEEGKETEETVNDIIEKEKAALNELKAGIEERTAKDANDKWLAELEEALTKEGYDKGLIKPMVSETVTRVAREVKANSPKVSQAMDTVVEAADKTPEMRSLGSDMGQGLIYGIMAEKGAVANAMSAVVEAAIQAAKQTAEVASPSKVFRLIGYFFDKGLALGVEENTNLAETSSRYLGESTIKALHESLEDQSDLLDDAIDISPLITPVLDLDDVKNTWRSMNFDDAVINARLRANDISAESVSRNELPVQQTTNNNTFNFNQTNNSPKELSRLDIYRQTKNQFSTFKREVLNSVSTGNSYQ